MSPGRKDNFFVLPDSSQDVYFFSFSSLLTLCFRCSELFADLLGPSELLDSVHALRPTELHQLPELFQGDAVLGTHVVAVLTEEEKGLKTISRPAD